MKRIRFTDYFLDRLRFRGVPQTTVEDVLGHATDRFFDIETGRFVAVKRVKYGGQYKRLMVVYEETNDEIIAVTVHAVTKRQIQSRLKHQRWVPK